MSFPTDHCTILALSAAPTPMMLEATAWVDDTGAPAAVDNKIAVVDATWESKLCIGRMRKILRPNVLMIFHPPPSVPTVIAIALASITQSGMLVSGAQPTEAMTRIIMPMAFWASLAPWLNESN